MQEKTSEELERDESGRLLPGQKSLNPNGRPKGAKNFATKWAEFIDKVADETGESPKSIDENLWKIAYEKALSGDYNFYRDIHDRVYGKPQQSVDVTTLGGAITEGLTEEQKKKLDNLL